MWNYNEKDIEKETAVAAGLNKSGCYSAKIISIENKKTTNGFSQIIFEFDIDGKTIKVFHVYEGKDGMIEFKVRILNHLLYLNKLKNPSDIEKCIDKNIGVMLKSKLSQDKKFINFDLEGVYHLESGKTASELKDNKPAKVVETKRKQYEEEEPLKREGFESGTSDKKEEIDDSDEFPFG